MDPPHGCRPWRPCLLHHPYHPHHHLHHHHHPHQPLFLCPHHHNHHHLHHQNNRTLFNCHVHTSFAPFPQNPEHSAAAAAIPFQTHSISEASGALQEQQKHGEIGDVVGLEEEKEEDDDPVFVLTDEWKEFFAKSEAKRRLEKQQAKKKKKKGKAESRVL